MLAVREREREREREGGREGGREREREGERGRECVHVCQISLQTRPSAHEVRGWLYIKTHEEY